jgi:hypothetical protein
MKIAVIPDVQSKPGVSSKFLTNVGRYIAEKEPDVVICLGDFADMPSLSSYDKGKKAFEGRRYKNDIGAARGAMENLIDGFLTNPQWYSKVDRKMLIGNHEERILRAVNNQSELEGLISYADLPYEDWKVHNFLDVVSVGGCAFSHYFTSGPMGRPVGTAQRLLTTKHMSCIAGHQQGRQIATAFKADGSPLTSIIAGSCYEHDEDYMGPQGNRYWRGILMMHEVKNGSYDEMFVSLPFLKKRFK